MLLPKNEKMMVKEIQRDNKCNWHFTTWVTCRMMPKYYEPTIIKCVVSYMMMIIMRIPP